MVKRYNSILARCVSGSGFVDNLAVFSLCCFQKLAFQNPARIAGSVLIGKLLSSVVNHAGLRLIERTISAIAVAR